jgi:hypothetical protein
VRYCVSRLCETLCAACSSVEVAGMYAVTGMQQCSVMGGEVAARGKRMRYVPS